MVDALRNISLATNRSKMLFNKEKPTTDMLMFSVGDTLAWITPPSC